MVWNKEIDELPFDSEMKNKKSVSAKKMLRVSLFFAGTVLLGACVPEDPEDPGFDKPAVTGVIKGDIRSVDAYLDAVEKENTKRTRREGDIWSNPEDF